MLKKLQAIVTSQGMITRGRTKLLRYYPAGIFLLKQPYSTGGSYKQTLTFRDYEERAILAYLTYSYIANLDQRQLLVTSKSFRQKIYQLEHLAPIIQKCVPTYQRDKKFQLEIKQVSNYKRLLDAGFLAKNINKIIEAYSCAQGTFINTDVWKQQRFLQALNPNGKITLQPNLGTKLIFKKITEQFHESTIISGTKGCGKSFAYFNYYFLSEFMTQYRLFLFKNEKLRSSERFKNLVNEAEFMKIKKLFYVPLVQIDAPQDLEQILSEQTEYLNINRVQLQASQFQKYNSIRTFISRFLSFYSQPKIESVFVADESNVYFSEFKSMQLSNANTFHTAQRYSDLLNCIRYKFDLVVYNSSQAVDAEKIHDWIEFLRNNSQLTFHDICSHDRVPRPTQNLHIGFDKFLFTEEGHIYLYTVLFDQICKHIPEIENHQTFRRIFSQYFGLPCAYKKENYNKSQLIWWQSDIKILNIRIGWQKRQEIELQQIRQLITLNEQTNYQSIKPRLQIALENIKNDIVENRGKLFLNTLSGYINKSQNAQIKAFRYALLFKIKRDYQNTQLNDKKCPFINVDFNPIIRQFQKINSTINYRQEASNISYHLGCGEPIQQNTQNDQTSDSSTVFYSKFKFLVNYVSLQQMVNRLAQKQDDVFIVTNRILDLQNFQHDIVGSLLDTLYYISFQFQQINLKVLEKTQFQIRNKEHSVKFILPFFVRTGRAPLDYVKQFKDIILLAKTNIQVQILAFQASKIKINPHNPKGYKLNTLNPIFDFVIVKNMSDHLLIQSYDETLGQLTGKVTKFAEVFNSLSCQIKSLNIKYEMKIIWNHRVLAYQHLVQQYFKINHTKFQFFHSIAKDGKRFPSPKQLTELMKNKDTATFIQGKSTEKIIATDLDLIDTQIGQISLKMAIIPNQDHLRLPLAHTVREKRILEQINKISTALKKQKNILSK